MSHLKHVLLLVRFRQIPKCVFLAAKSSSYFSYCKYLARLFCDKSPHLNTTDKFRLKTMANNISENVLMKEKNQNASVDSVTPDVNTSPKVEVENSVEEQQDGNQVGFE